MSFQAMIIIMYRIGVKTDCEISEDLFTFSP